MNILIGYIMDLILGDPEWLPHPVVGMGRLISRLEKALRRLLPKTNRGEFIAGALTSVVTVFLTAFLCFGLVYVFRKEFLPLAIALDIIMCWQALAVKSLADEAKNIRKKLEVCEDIRSRLEKCENLSDCAAPKGGAERGASHPSGSLGLQYETDSERPGERPKAALQRDYEKALKEARKAVARVVGRDTDRLDESGIIRATVETVAENFADGVAAPLFYMAIGSGPLALCYKAVNTLDSMIGYKNERYLYFGRFGAHLDDVAGFIPSRVAALAFIIIAALSKNLSGREALRIWRRDRKNHASPNSAQSESACAGALGIELAGPAYYFGEYYDKPTIGDATRPVEIEDIDRSVWLMQRASLLLVILAAAVNFILFGIL